MNTSVKISHKSASRRQVLSVVSMMFLLVFLTSINFFLYPSSDKELTEISSSSSPAGPDEKSPDAPVSINEEYVHESHHEFNSFLTNALIEHKIHEAEKLCFVHFDLFSPPPEV
jgi:hypothetical protein